ncbi:MAG TPA: pyridoxal phosphate-dependent aminotransferase [Fimbriimonadaceae bacterium]|nr:pyridoxal phosphate-dependent aminotransferase [Fimbriimonadaceae bacterium]
MTLTALAARAAALSPSPTLSISARANAMKAEGIDVVSFGAGEPDFSTPEPICDAAIAALKSGFTKYTPTGGSPDLKQAAAEKLWRENALKVDPSQIVVSCGAKHSIYNAMMVLVDPGDEVILPSPYWMTYAEQVRLAGGIPVPVPSHAEDGFVPDPDAIKAAVSPRTRAIMLNTPCNPTGAVFPRSLLKEIAALALRHGFWIISDEIYEKLIYDGEKHVSPASLGEDVAAQTVTVQGCSKSYAMTGWRIGFAAAPKPVAQAMTNLQDQVTSNPTSFAQKGAIAALNMPPAEIEAMRVEFEARRDLIVAKLREIPSVTVANPKGAFYVMPDFRAYLGGKIKDDPALASFLLENVHVAAVPGSVFGGDGHLRLSYATSRENIERGVARIAEALHGLG